MQRSGSFGPQPSRLSGVQQVQAGFRRRCGSGCPTRAHRAHRLPSHRWINGVPAGPWWLRWLGACCTFAMGWCRARAHDGRVGAAAGKGLVGRASLKTFLPDRGDRRSPFAHIGSRHHTKDPPCCIAGKARQSAQCAAMERHLPSTAKLQAGCRPSRRRASRSAQICSAFTCLDQPGGVRNVRSWARSGLESADDHRSCSCPP